MAQVVLEHAHANYFNKLMSCIWQKGVDLALHKDKVTRMWSSRLHCPSHWPSHGDTPQQHTIPPIALPHHYALAAVGEGNKGGGGEGSRVGGVFSLFSFFLELTDLFGEERGAR
jgi:hypothetical protein